MKSLQIITIMIQPQKVGLWVESELTAIHKDFSLIYLDIKTYTIFQTTVIETLSKEVSTFISHY